MWEKARVFSREFRVAAVERVRGGGRGGARVGGAAQAAVHVEAALRGRGRRRSLWK
jgi:hypothetical protein